MAVEDDDCIIRTQRLVLQPLQPTNAARVAAILSSPRVGRMISRIGLPYPYEMALAWLETHASERALNTAFRFGVQKDEYLIGCVDVAGVDDGLGELGYWFDPAYAGKGYALEAAEAVLCFAFEKLNLRTLSAFHASDNTASRKLLSRLGFKPDRSFEAWYESRQQTIVQVSNKLEKADWKGFR